MSDGTIGPAGLAAETGVSTDTLRHYERKGLLARPQRTRAGYRRYPAHAVTRVRLIQRALVVGFSLDELGRVLRERDRGGTPCRGVRALLATRMSDLDAQLYALKTLRRELTALARDWDAKLAATPPGVAARLLDDLPDRRGLDRPARRERVPRPTSSPRRA